MKSNKIFSIALSVFVSFVFIFAVTFAASTISTNISTGGTLTVSDTSTLTGAVTMSSTLGVTGLTTLGNATTTRVSVSNALWVGGNATTTASNGNFATLGTLVGSSTMQVTGATTLYSTLNVSGLTTLANASTTNVSASGNLWVNGNATTTSAGNISTNGSLTLANSSTAINGIVFGFCNIANSANITASSTGYFNCTGATGITTSHRVFVQATSSLPTNLIVVAASSTAQDTINLLIYNTGTTGLVAPGGISLNFFGIR